MLQLVTFIILLFKTNTLLRYLNYIVQLKYNSYHVSPSGIVIIYLLVK